ncbi:MULTISPECIES: galactitol-1-phosphate 5-dehydrogenase [Clostridium]|jgi:L-iditol 2-dehydrogenase|uniref:Galactitol-1-phosphate 5-dehydrogenase n=1 Tax=Clostridium thermopalmarium DSM 5974 TaxID=1121340 RepID=A0A2T0APR6_9CLOT|nr:galactitol-1-phosphate 5-dehydrogenase [Clostridium thermopalmarium]MBE6042973.1 galactitol-1-phosphate 5-dehydrogenase [Clostridium thermopalmarium]PRR71006.1 Galactitol-1-phosphate 5-dehydrogenase [Clostridium thermopalmarium DSM 5974]PVZ23654.1 L-iditol 2-dehydrogenase [Clostridium thermopalmarium DSM 5974]
MKAGVVHARDDIRYEEIEKPIPRKGQVLIKVKYTGICGSDVPRVNGDACHFFPNVLGHEFSGTVAQIGEGVTSVKVGDRVAGVPLVPCMKCENCQKGDYSLCKQYSFIGSRQFGSFAEYVVVPEKNAIPFDNDVSFEQGAFFEPATVALHGIMRVPYEGGKTVAILGGGTIGMFVMQWARIFGARETVIFDIASERLELGKRLGATAGINTLDEGFMERAMELTGGRGFDYVFETAGNTITMKMAFELAANKAHLCFIGTPTKELSFSVKEWENMNRKEFTLTGSWMSYSAPFPGIEWKLVSHYFKTGDLKFDESFIFTKIPLSRIADAFQMYKVPGAARGKILIDSEG